MQGCEDFHRRFDVFLDGETDGHSMRELALHVSHCPSCEEELRRSEALQDLLTQTVTAEVNRVEAAELWREIETRLEAPRLSLGERLREGRTTREWIAPVLRPFAIAAALAAAVVGILWLQQPASRPMVVANNEAQISTLASSAPDVAVWSEPQEHTTAIWVASYEP